MRNIVVSLLIVTALSAVSLSYAVSPQTTEANPENAVIVYYFHGNFRCTNCYNMEQWTKDLIDNCFRDQAARGKLVFKMYNTDEKENERFLNDYKLYTKSVVLSLVKEGKEVRYDNLAKVWDCLRSKQKFQEYVRGEIDKYLKEL